MLTHAIKFAENYRAHADKISARAQGSVRHPSLYIFAGKDDSGVFSQIENYAARSNTAFFLRVGELEPSGRSIRLIKTEIQKNEAGLNLKRVNISVIVNACEKGADIFVQTGQRIREIFEEDIAVVHVSLFFLLSESNKWDDFEQRAANAYEILKRAENFQRETEKKIFDRVFVLSDRNELDTVSDANAENNARIIAELHSLLSVGSRFEENLNKKSLDEDKIFFATAGMARLEKPSFEIAFAVFKRVAECTLEAYRKILSKKDSPDEGKIEEYYRQDGAFNENEIINKMQSVASRSVNPWSLRGKTLREAEAMLYGDGAERFFYANYKPVWNAPDLSENFSSAEQKAALLYFKKEVESFENKSDEFYRRECKPGLIGGTNVIKRMIAEAYGIRYKAEYVREKLKAVEQALERAEEKEKRLKIFIKELSEAVAELNRRPDPGKNITAYYGQAVDLYLNESEDGIGIETDMNGLCEKISAFIEKYIWPHEAVNLSFDEDLRKRSAAAPGEYDRNFITSDEFYRRTLADLDKQSALAVSLIRYDDLYREKYYFGSADSPLMLCAGRERTGEAVYTLEEPAGFTVIRLAGGFTVEDMTRHKIMLEQYKKREI